MKCLSAKYTLIMATFESDDICTTIIWKNTYNYIGLHMKALIPGSKIIDNIYTMQNSYGSVSKRTGNSYITV